MSASVLWWVAEPFWLVRHRPQMPASVVLFRTVVFMVERSGSLVNLSSVVSRHRRRRAAVFVFAVLVVVSTVVVPLLSVVTFSPTAPGPSSPVSVSQPSR